MKVNRLVVLSWQTSSIFGEPSYLESIQATSYYGHDDQTSVILVIYLVLHKEVVFSLNLMEGLEFYILILITYLLFDMFALYTITTYEPCISEEL